MKLILKFIFGLLIVYALFVVEESYRLKKDMFAEPLLVIDKEVNVDLENPDEDAEIFNSIGFRLKKTYVRDEKSKNDLLYKHITSEEFVLFDEFVIWAWIE